MQCINVNLRGVSGDEFPTVRLYMKHPHKGCSANPEICIPSSEYIRHARNDEQVALKKNYVKGVFEDYFGRVIESVLEHILEDIFERKTTFEKSLKRLLKRVSLRTTVENCFRVRFEKTFEKNFLGNSL